MLKIWFYPDAATYDLWTPAFSSAKWGHNTNPTVQLWQLNKIAFEKCCAG